MDTYHAKLSYVQFEGPKVEVDLQDPYNKSHQLPQHENMRSNGYKDLCKAMSDGLKEGITAIHQEAEKRDYTGPPCPLLSQYFPECFKSDKTGYVSGGNTDTDSRNREVKVIDDDFFGIQALNVSHLGARYSLAPSTYVNSEFLDLMWIRKDKASRIDFMNAFVSAKYLSAEEEKIYHESMEIDRTQVMKLEPIDAGTYVSIDGEAAEYATTYVELHKGLANVVVL